jgi:uncharacterized protein (TIGR00159 family)
MTEALTETLSSVRIAELVDLVVVWAMVWAGIVWLRATPARLALGGLGILVSFYLVARQFGLVLTTWILQGFAAVAVLVAVVVFQQELRRLFEQIAALGFRRRLLPAGPDAIDTLARSIAHLAQQRRGALLVFPGRQAVEGHVEGGMSLHADITEPLLLSLFDPHSPGHDGAVIVSGNRLTRFAVHLPLSTDHAQLGQRGTRHAAALGLAERTDALCVAVSEERGTVSVAREGRLRTLGTPQEVAGEIREFFEHLAPTSNKRPGRFKQLRGHWREALVALPIAGLLWFLAIPGATVVEIDREVRVSVGPLPEGYALEAVDPERVMVTLAGRRRDLYFLRPDELEVRVEPVLVDRGRRSFSVTREHVSHPEVVEVRDVEPDRVRLSLRERAAGPAAPAEPQPR